MNLDNYNSEKEIAFCKLPSSTKLFSLRQKAMRARNPEFWSQEEIDYARAKAEVMAYILAGYNLPADYDGWDDY